MHGTQRWLCLPKAVSGHQERRRAHGCGSGGSSSLQKAQCSRTTAVEVSGLKVYMCLPGFEVDAQADQLHPYSLMIYAGRTLLLVGMLQLFIGPTQIKPRPGLEGHALLQCAQHSDAADGFAVYRARSAKGPVGLFDTCVFS